MTTSSFTFVKTFESGLNIDFVVITNLKNSVRVTVSVSNSRYPKGKSNPRNWGLELSNSVSRRPSFPSPGFGGGEGRKFWTLRGRGRARGKKIVTFNYCCPDMTSTFLWLGGSNKIWWNMTSIGGFKFSVFTTVNSR